MAKTSAKTVQNCLVSLEKAGVIKRTYASKGKINRKNIVPLVAWGVPPVGGGVPPVGGGGVPPAGGHIENIYNKRSRYIYNTSQGEVSNDEIGFIISLFSSINPSYKLLYRRNNQREAVGRMLSDYGKEPLSRIIAYAISIRGEQFAPTITTPIQLEEKLGKLKIYYEKNHNKNKKGVQVWEV